LSSSAFGNDVGEDAGIGGFWAVAMMVDTSRNVRSRRMGGRVLGEKDNSFWLSAMTRFAARTSSTRHSAFTPPMY
jgi:hypothetical protein